MRVLFVLLVLILLASASYAQPVNIRVSAPGLIDPEEVSIAVNPKHPNELAVGANIRYFFTSTDSGQTWASKTIDQQYGVWGDPCLLYDDSGVLYYEHLSGHGWPPRDTEFLWRIVVQRILDEPGFDEGAEIGFAPPTMQDKAWLTSDRSQTPSKGNLYTSWTEFDLYGSHAPTDSSRIYFAKSVNYDVTWSERVRVDDTAGDCLDGSNTTEGATTAVSKDGTINVAWSAHNKIYLDRSTDGGKSFGRDRIIADQPGGWDFAVPGISRANGLPMLSSDLDTMSSYYGRLYLLWSDQRRGVTDVYFSFSSDDGSTWTSAARVNSDSAMNHHFFPSMSVDPLTGHIFIVFYDRRNYEDNQTDVYLARSTDGGATFSNERISESAFLPYSKVFFGDYIHIVAYDRHVYPVWMRESDSLLSVWTAPIYDSGLSLAVAQHPLPEKLWTINGQRTSLAFSLATSKHVSIELFDLLGKKVSSLLSGTFASGEYHIAVPQDLPAAAYIARMTAISQTNDAASGFSSLVTKVVVP